MMAHYVGQRLSLKGQACTVQYVGAVADKPGTWLGVEWDDPGRGKHDGTHDGTKYFECMLSIRPLNLRPGRRTYYTGRNPSPRAASFLKPSQPWDKPRTFLQALREKYMPEDTGTSAEAIYFSTKQAEEVGFDKLARRQARLHGIHVLVLDRMQMRASQDREEDETIMNCCANVTELDLGGNLFESLDEIIRLAGLFPKLSLLNISGNRFVCAGNAGALPTVRTLDVSDTSLRWAKIVSVTKSFPNIRKLTVARNGLSSICPGLLPNGVQNLDLSDNDFSKLADLAALGSCPNLQILTLKRNRVQAVDIATDNHPLNASIETLDLARNAVSSWSLIDALAGAYPALKHLITTANPIYEGLQSAEGKPLASQDGYMLTIARLPQLSMLNYSKITEKERLNSETYYLGQIAVELAKNAVEDEEKVLRRHTRWTYLCEEYGRPIIARAPKANELDPNSLAARLINVSFEVSPTALPEYPTRSWQQEIPKTFNVYSLHGLVGKKLGVMPLKVRLIWETGERDPLGQRGAYSGPEWWDSSDESDDDAAVDGQSVLREVELIPGTRALGTYIEGREARIRVELRDGQ